MHTSEPTTKTDGGKRTHEKENTEHVKNTQTDLTKQAMYGRENKNVVSYEKVMFLPVTLFPF